MLDDSWRDIISIGSLAITLVGFVATLVGLWWAYEQLRKTQAAAQAAEAASKQALAEARAGFQKFAVAVSHRFINEAKIHVENRAWDKAAMRVSDLANQAAHLAGEDEAWQAIVSELRIWSATCHRLATGKLKVFPITKWIGFCVTLEAKIDGLMGPFQSPPGGGAE